MTMIVDADSAAGGMRYPEHPPEETRCRFCFVPLPGAKSKQDASWEALCLKCTSAMQEASRSSFSLGGISELDAGGGEVLHEHEWRARFQDSEWEASPERRTSRALSFPEHTLRVTPAKGTGVRQLALTEAALLAHNEAAVAPPAGYGMFDGSPPYCRTSWTMPSPTMARSSPQIWNLTDSASTFPPAQRPGSKESRTPETSRGSLGLGNVQVIPMSPPCKSPRTPGDSRSRASSKSVPGSPAELVPKALLAEYYRKEEVRLSAHMEATRNKKEFEEVASKSWWEEIGCVERSRKEHGHFHRTIHRRDEFQKIEPEDALEDDQDEVCDELCGVRRTKARQVTVARGTRVDI